jgi:hypothetical protein
VRIHFTKLKTTIYRSYSYAPCPDSRARNGQSPTYCVAQMKDFFQTIDREYSLGNASMIHVNRTRNLIAQDCPRKDEIEEGILDGAAT